MDVAALEGPLLDYWVARAAGLPQPRVDDGFCWVEEPACDGDPAGALEAAFAPSTDWSQGGPIIQSERIALSPRPVAPHEWRATVPGDAQPATPDSPLNARGATGSTPLVAAMRAYVAAHFGATVEDNAAP